MRMLFLQKIIPCPHFEKFFVKWTAWFLGVTRVSGEMILWGHHVGCCCYRN